MKNFNKISAIAILVLSSLVLFSCATASKISAEKDALPAADISAGLPAEGLWRENLALYDINGDGYLDIVAPPPRKAKKGWDRPFVFVWDASEKKWSEGKYTFSGNGYDYGSVAVGDLRGTGRPDIVLAQHGRGIVLFMNDKDNNFVESMLPVKEDFRSRSIVVSDINGDGRLDIVAVSEAPFSSNYEPRGILLGINEGDKGWDTTFLEESKGLFADSMAVGDLKGTGNKDVAVAQLTSDKAAQKLIWFGDGKGDFKSYSGDLFGEQALPYIVRTGDVAGDRKEAVVFGLGLFGGGSKEKGRLAVLKWTGDGFKDISAGLNLGYLIAFDLADIDGDGKAELLVLTETGIHIYKYEEPKGWIEQGHFPVPFADISNVTDLRAGRNRDGSVIIVYNLGKYDADGLNRGIRAYRLKSGSAGPK